MGNFRPKLLTQLLPGPPPAATSPARDQGVQCKSPATPNTAVGHLVPHKKKGHNMVKIEALGYFPSLQLGWKARVRGSVPSITPAHAKRRRGHQHHTLSTQQLLKKLIWVQFKPPPGNGDGMGASHRGARRSCPRRQGRTRQLRALRTCLWPEPEEERGERKNPENNAGKAAMPPAILGAGRKPGEAGKAKPGNKSGRKRCGFPLLGLGPAPAPRCPAGCPSGWLSLCPQPCAGPAPAARLGTARARAAAGPGSAQPAAGREHPAAPPAPRGPRSRAREGLREHRAPPLSSSPRVPSPLVPPYLGSGGAQHHTGGGRRSPARPRIPARAALPAAPGLGWA